ncbi:hypothetical protein [Subtercola sp. YIM 133946]|uniref:hypothetical protein n=1 Tax=Subtercola sp. YIM 133946 TaxID=3118909 RepID=UPI002F92BB0B
MSAGRGRTQVTARALTRVVTALAATALDVAPSRVSVSLSDHDGALAVSISSPIRVVSLNQIGGDDNAVLRSGGTVLERAERAQSVVREQAQYLTGSSIHSVTIRLNGAEIRHQERVK